MTTTKTLTVLALSLIMVSVPACDSLSYPPYDREALLRETVETVILPGYARLDASAASLTSATTMLCASPSRAALTTARTAWHDTFIAWSHTTGYAIGPAYTQLAVYAIGFWPAAVDGIEADIAGSDTIDAAWVASVLASHRGLYALEYLLFAGASDDAVVAALGDTRRCTLVVALAQHVGATTTALSSAWDRAGGNYAATFENPGATNAVYTSISSPTNELIQQMIDTLKNVNSIKLATPLGLHTGMPVPGAVESPYAHASVDAMTAELAGIRDAWAAPTHSLSDLLRSRNAPLADEMLSDMDAAAAAISVIPEPLSTYASSSDHAAGSTAHMRIEAIETTLSTEVAAILGLSVTYSNDMD